MPNAEERVREQEEEERGRVVKVVPFDHVREDRTQADEYLDIYNKQTVCRKTAAHIQTRPTRKSARAGHRKPPEPPTVWATFSLWAALILTGSSRPLVFYKPAV